MSTDTAPADYLLACEFLGQRGSLCAWALDDRALLTAELAPRQHVQCLPGLLDDCLRRFGRPQALALAHGPGSFTGLRVSVLAMRTLAWIEALPVHAVCSLAGRALAAGPGCWWVWQSLKRDTTFQACFRVSTDPETSAWRLTTLRPVTAQADAEPPTCPAAEAVVIGPALADKPHLREHWAAGQPCASAAPLDAHAIARVACAFPAIGWRDLLPAYHQASAAELQRQASSG